MGVAAGSCRRTFQSAPQIESANITAVASCRRKTPLQAAGRPCHAAAKTTQAGPMRQITGLTLTRSEMRGAPIKPMRASSLAPNGEVIGESSGSVLLMCANLARSPGTISAAQPAILADYTTKPARCPYQTRRASRPQRRQPSSSRPALRSDNQLQPGRLDGDIEAFGIGVDDLAIGVNRQRIV